MTVPGSDRHEAAFAGEGADASLAFQEELGFAVVPEHDRPGLLVRADDVVDGVAVRIDPRGH